MAYNNDIALIVRYDGTKEAFELVKDNYLGKVVFIYGSKDEVDNQAGLVQAIWISDETSGRYLDMANVDYISENLTHISGIKVDDKTYYPASGGGNIAFKGEGGITITVNKDTGEIVFDSTNLQTTANTAYNTANTALNKANANSTLITNLGTEITNIKDDYATKEELETTKNSLIGEGDITSADDSIKGAKAYARELIDDLEGTTNTALLKKADLKNGKILESQLPDYILGQLLFGGTIQAGGANMMEVTPSAKLLDKSDKSETTESLTIKLEEFAIYEGAYFIVTGGLTSIFGFSVVVGDWIISTGTDWRKVDNTDAIVTVAGITPVNGNINASTLAEKLASTGDDNELALKSEVEGVKNSLDTTVTEVRIMPADTDYLTFNVSKSGTIRTITYDVKTDNTVGDAINDTEKKGLATVEDIASYLKNRLSVKVVS